MPSMYKLVFKGSGIDPIFLEDEKGKVIMDAYLNNKSMRLIANNQAFNTSDIKTIHLVEKSRSEKYARNTSSEEQEYAEFRKKMLSLPIEKRANILRIPKLVWSSNTDTEMTDEVKKKIIERQLAYFKENPNCIYTNPTVYKDLIPQKREVPVRDGVKSINSIIGASMLRFIGNAIATDLQYALKK